VKEALPTRSQIYVRSAETNRTYTCRILNGGRAFQRYIGNGWYDYLDYHKPKAGDCLLFSLKYPYNLMIVTLMRRKDLSGWIEMGPVLKKSCFMSLFNFGCFKCSCFVMYQMLLLIVARQWLRWYAILNALWYIVVWIYVWHTKLMFGQYYNYEFNFIKNNFIKNRSIFIK
jgi:hypothetical protein